MLSTDSVEKKRLKKTIEWIRQQFRTRRQNESFTDRFLLSASTHTRDTTLSISFHYTVIVDRMGHFFFSDNIFLHNRKMAHYQRDLAFLTSLFDRKCNCARISKDSNWITIWPDGQHFNQRHRCWKEASQCLVTIPPTRRVRLLESLIIFWSNCWESLHLFFIFWNSSI